MRHDWLDHLRLVKGGAGRRQGPRVPASGAFCTEYTPTRDNVAMLSDLSPTGLRLHRPYRGARSEVVQLEFDLPGIDEVIWCKGVACFDYIWRPKGSASPWLHTTGIRVAAAAGAQLKLLRDYAREFAPRFMNYSERRALGALR